MSEKIKVIHVRIHDYEVIEIDNTLKELQRLVGGYIEPAAPMELWEKKIELLVNEHGLLKGLEPNEVLAPFFFVGDGVLMGVNSQDLTGLTDDQIEFLSGWLESLKRT